MKKNMKILLFFLLFLELLVIFVLLFHPSFITGLFSDDYHCKDCNVVLISIDTLRADHLGAYGHYRNTSPNVDLLAAEGLLFEKAFSQSPLTVPSHMTMFTSLYPSVHKVCNYERSEDYCSHYLSFNYSTLAQILHDYGYVTGGFTGGGHVSELFGFSRGFDVWKEYRNRRNESETLQSIVDISNWVETVKDKKFFLFYHTYIVHDPYISPSRFHLWIDINKTNIYLSTEEILNDFNNSEVDFRKIFWAGVNHSDPSDLKQLLGLYDGGVLYADEQVGLIIDKLKEVGVYDKTIIIFTADHGEEFLEHNEFLHWKLYNEILHVPLIIRLPGVESKKINNYVGLVDIVPTLLDFLGIFSLSQFQGVSLKPMIFGYKEAPRIVFSESVQNYRYSVISGDWKYISRKDGVVELYNITDDFYEQKNVAKNFPLVVNHLETLLNETLETIHDESSKSRN
ncbi:MAG: sulfatase-like hydrolase/transferase [Nanoarchaeota archaeon]|nr:sulfatase-like hydrolase/transferase [Nanoarchaeota archaeon]MBU1604511.1 sulfatase-like hydrolase/transferase [Nanoarchaeota archaeon]